MLLDEVRPVESTLRHSRQHSRRPAPPTAGLGPLLRVLYVVIYFSSRTYIERHYDIDMDSILIISFMAVSVFRAT